MSIRVVRLRSAVELAELRRDIAARSDEPLYVRCPGGYDGPADDGRATGRRWDTQAPRPLSRNNRTGRGISPAQQAARDTCGVGVPEWSDRG